MPADLHAVPPVPDEPDPGPPRWRQGPARQRLLDDPRFDWARVRPGRRLLVVAFGAVVLAGAVALWFFPQVPLLAAVPVATLPVLVFVIGSLNMATRGLTDLREEYLDERQRAVRGRAYRTAYRLVVLAASVGYGVLVVATATRSLPVDPVRWLALGYVAALAAWLLPTLVAAWVEED